MRRVALSATALLLAACATTTPPGDPGKVLVETDPQGATITFIDASTCVTPCEVSVPMPMTIVVGKAGFKAVRADLAPGDADVTYTLEPVGRSAPVEVFDLDEEPGS